MSTVQSEEIAWASEPRPAEVLYRHEASVEGLETRVVETSEGANWYVFGVYEGINVMASGYRKPTEAAKVAAIEAAKVLAAKGWAGR